MKRGRPQAKDIPDAKVLAILASISAQRRAIFHDNPGAWTFTWDVEENLPGQHPKVVLAKMRALIKRGLVEGCACGCRGDFFLTAAGKEAHAKSGVILEARQRYPMEPRP